TTSSSPLLDASQVAGARRGTVHLDATLPAAGGPVRLLAEPNPAARGTVLVIGVSVGSSVELENRLLFDLLLALIPVALASGLGAYLLAGAALRPVERLRREAAAISAHDTRARLTVPATGDEVAALGRTMDQLLARLQEALRRQREFVSDAGHELRTPLAVLRTELELAARPGRSAPELVAAVRSAGEESERLQALTENLLVLARSDEGGIALDRQQSFVAKVVDEACSSLLVQAGLRRVTLAAEVG
ncbi:multi-sensor hybrid histidine kinase, partial [mine drainage metagenome]